jgi:type 1 fimbria pilin
MGEAGMIRTLTIAAAALALSGCASSPSGQPTIPSEVAGSGACKVDKYRDLVGKQAVDIDRATLPKSFRIVCQDCALTTDNRPDRLTILLNRANQVESVRCQ